MRTGIQTKSMAPLTKAMQAATKAMPAGRLGNKERSAKTKARKPLDWREVNGLVEPIIRAGAIMASIAESERPALHPDAAAKHTVRKEDVSQLDDGMLAAYAGKLRRELELAKSAASMRRTRCRNAQGDAAAVARGIGEIKEHEDEVREVFAVRADAAAKTAEAFAAAVDTLEAQLAEAIAEQERRTPKSAADLAREVDAMRDELEQLRARSR